MREKERAKGKEVRAVRIRENGVINKKKSIRVKKNVSKVNLSRK